MKLNLSLQIIDYYQAITIDLKIITRIKGFFMKKINVPYLFFILFTYITAICAEAPQLTIVVVFDQCAFRNLEKIRPYLKGGLRFLVDEGIYYTQAHTPYAWPATGPGHATLNTGTVPATHGIINNAWANEKYERVDCDDDTAERAAVFGPNGLLDYGKSPQYIMVDGISDQLVMQKKQHQNYNVFAISGKSRSAICAANKLGKAVWLDPKTGMFTSSKAYYNALPSWVKNFNERKRIKNQKYIWQLQHGCLPRAYQFKNAHNYKGTQANKTMIGRTFCLSEKNKQYEEFMLTPQANQLVFDAALACIDEHFCKCNSDEKMFLWVLPSALDKLGHAYGPNSIEAIDMIYHFDRQLKKFMDCVNTKTRKRNILWAMTSDHGICPIPEQLKEEGYSTARRIMGSKISEKLNEHLQKKFGLEKVAIFFNGSSLYVNEPLLKTVEKKKRKQVKKEIKSFICNQPGIKQVWTFNELRKLYLPPNSIESYFKNQLFKGRSSSFIVQSYPYNYIAQHEYGTGHRSPYDYDTHIPLIIYQRANYQRKVIHDRVTNTQFAPTLAHILGVPKPSASTTDILPGIIFKEDPCF